MAPLAKVNRIRLGFDAGIREIIRLAALLDSGKTVESSIAWKDGLPDDEAETVQIEAMAVAAGITSKISAMKRAYDYDDKQAADEQKQIEKETPAIAEPVNFAAKTDNDDGSST